MHVAVYDFPGHANITLGMQTGFVAEFRHDVAAGSHLAFCTVQYPAPDGDVPGGLDLRGLDRSPDGETFLGLDAEQVADVAPHHRIRGEVKVAGLDIHVAGDLHDFVDEQFEVLEHDPTGDGGGDARPVVAQLDALLERHFPNPALGTQRTPVDVDAVRSRFGRRDPPDERPFLDGRDRGHVVVVERLVVVLVGRLRIEGIFPRECAVLTFGRRVPGGDLKFTLRRTFGIAQRLHEFRAP